MKFGSGGSLPRVEDCRLLTGGGRYLDDLSLDGLTHAVFVRSPHAHAHIVAVDTRAAAAAAGIHAVYTGKDLVEDHGLGAVPFRQFPPLPQVTPLTPPPRYPLMPDIVRYVGDNVALVVAETLEQALDAAELVDVEYQVLDAVANPAVAVTPEAPQIWSGAPNNVVGVWAQGDEAAVDAAIAGAARVTEIELVNNRLVPNSMETRGCTCEFDGNTGRYTLHIGVQMPHLLKTHLCEDVFHIAEDRLRVVVPDIGGGFGMKVFCYPEYAAVMFAAGQLGQPVRWCSGRSEAFISDIHGRDQVNRAQLAFDGDGKIVAMKVQSLGNMGAYIAYQGAFIPTVSSFRVLSNTYEVPALYGECKCVLTNTGPTDAYRGAGRPEAVYLMERLMDKAAAEMALDPVELRRRNMVAKSAMPYTNATGMVIDSGDFPRMMDVAMAAHDWPGFAARREAAQRRGRLAGRGLAMYIEHTGRNEFTETVDISVSGGGGSEEGSVTVYSGTQEMGQGLKTTYVQLVAERLQIDPARIAIIQGDTDLVATGGGSGGSRSLYVGGSATVVSTQALIDEARNLAADALEAAAADLEFAVGRFTVAGTDRSIGLFELAAAQPDAMFAISETTTSGDLTWPNGCHICEVEIDPDTGEITLTRFTAVDDVGTVVNHVIVDGQVHGGVAQGIGQALLERVAYDRDGQILSGSFMDYTMPRADDVPFYTVVADETSPCTTNILGAKGAGECGSTGAPPAVVGAVCDALKDFGVVHLDMPISGEDVWRAINGGR
ncbi:MAG: xanthine dehydrogenase family protein molybdopterin-binding subunit [Alphaproteobacteria bacterium]|nr:xanthine dehydrogenase family protein molybdopterin-binding subunit [Alphaproteobacteria bacterium]